MAKWAKLPAVLIRQIIAKLPNVRFTQGYGMTRANQKALRGDWCHTGDMGLPGKAATFSG